MALVVNSNIASLNAQRNLTRSQSSLSTSLQRLSSGLRVNSAKDDAAGLYISQLLTKDIRGTNQAIRNSADGISLAQTAEGALSEIGNNLQRMRELAVQSVNGSISDAARTGLQEEFDELVSENTRIVADTEFNGTALLGATLDVNIQVGVDMGDVVAVNGGVAALTGIGGVGTQAAAETVLAELTDDINAVSTSRARFGAAQNRFEAVIANLSNFAENLTASRSRVLDADFAVETANLTRAQILQQAGTSILAQANSLPQAALSLLG